MRTHFIDMGIELQKMLVSFHDLAKSVSNFRFGSRIDPLSFVYEVSKRSDFPELITDKRIGLNPRVVSAYFVEALYKYQNIELLLKENLYSSGGMTYLQNNNDTEFKCINCRNYNDGVKKLFAEMKKSYIFLRQPSVKQVGSGMTLTYPIKVFVWIDQKKSFVCIAEQKDRSDNRFYRTEGWGDYLDFFGRKKNKTLKSK